MNQPVAAHNGFALLARDLRERTLGPIGHFTFWGFLIAGVVGFGGVGLWYECVKHYFSNEDNTHAIRTALVTFAPALAGANAFQLIASNSKKQMRFFGAICLCLLLVFPGWLTFDHSMREPLAFLYAALVALFAIWIWWLANAHEEIFRDEVDPVASVGGSTDEAPAGNLEDMKY